MSGTLENLFDDIAEIVQEAERSNNLEEDISDFHTKFNRLPEHDYPHQLSEEMAQFRINFMQEELDEYKAAVANGNLEGQLDALVDLVYVAIGTAYLQGLPFNKAWERVHHANMRKVAAKSADESKRGTAFDIVKPEGWLAPKLHDLVKA